MPDVRNLLALVLLSISTAVGAADAILDEMFQDHAVLQRDRAVPVWGIAQPNEQVVVTFRGQQTSAQSDAKGEWRVQLPATPAGGPYELAVRTASGAEQKVNDILVGDVWVCSGQSNMEMQVRSSLNAYGEIQRASNDSIRLLTISRTTSATPQHTFATPVRWQAVTPASIADFSAVCFYFARELQKHVDVPMGLIHASWGGSKIEPWMSVEALRAAGGYEKNLNILELRDSQPKAAIKEWSRVWESWWATKNAGQQPWLGKSEGVWARAPHELSHWEGWGVTPLAQFNGMVWLRANVELTAKQAKQAATLGLGWVDDVDMTWLNGEAIGSTAGPDTERNYSIDKGLLRAGVNTIVVNALDLWGPGGMYGPSESRALKLQDGTAIPLDGRWEYTIVPASIGQPPRAPWDSTAGLSVIGNAMIAPLGHYRARGVLWYQGESNWDEPQRYQGLLAAWMKDWRARFGEDAAFLIVQLANFGPAPSEPTESGWAGVRESQRLAVANDKNAGLAVAIDLGDRYDIHPANKQQVGYRLARAARHVVYGESITPSGPVPVKAERSGDEVVISFEDVDDSLVTYSSDRAIGFELCGNGLNSCRYAGARVEGNTVRVSGAKATDERVRFCWADSPVCNLYDGAALPAGPFEMDIGY